MAHVLVRLTVKEQAEWKKTFEEGATLREIFVLGKYKDLDQAREMFQSQEFRDATQKAGVVGAPEVTYLDNVAKLEH